MIRVFILFAIFFIPSTSFAQAPYPSKVNLHFDHWYDYAEMTKALHDLVEAYPELLAIESLGKSVGGREIWIVTLNNPATGSDRDKTAMFIDGNIHGNEIQAAETVLYSIWYLCKSFGVIDRITELIDERSFYFVPMANPDGREVWFHQPAYPHYLRGGIRPVDNDHDGLFDEDGPDDLDGDGHITSMWIKDELGRYEIDENDPRFFTRVDANDPPGGWSRLGQEGIDNDDDGKINEDGIGGYDPNRNWPADWQPEWIQYGATDYPFSLPETRVIGEFLLDHPNVAACQSYHNAGGMILQGPSASYVKYPRSDERVHSTIANKGAEMLPFYEPMIAYKDLYTVHGGEDGFTYEALGIVSFTNELWSDKRMYARESNPSRDDRKQFRDLLQFEDVFVPYHEVDHPTYGKVMVGGTKKYSSRITPPWMLEEGCHRNFAFTMFHADEMPLLSWGALDVKKIGNQLWKVTVEVANDKIIPSRTAMAAKHHIGSPDVLECKSSGTNSVAASGTVPSIQKTTKLDAIDSEIPNRILVNNGISGKGNTLFQFIVTGFGEVDFTYTAQKGGVLEQKVQLKEQFVPKPIEHKRAIPSNPS
ncbi:MAG: peptidase M14 [Planctomycetes bacterium]|nr:peptidase M14 [Planctomycetota bacterium]